MSAKGHETDLLEPEQAKSERRVVVSSVGGTTSTAAGRRRELERLLTDPTFFRTVADTMPDVGFIVDLEGNFVYASAAAERLTGYSPEQLRKMNMAEVVTPEVLAVLKDRMKRRIRGEQLPEMEFEIVVRDGSRRVVEMRTSPIVDQEDNLLGIQVLVRDITDRRRAERESERRADYLRALAELSVLLLEPRKDTPVAEALEILGKAAHVQRVTLYDHIEDDQGDVVAVRRAMWLSELMEDLYQRPSVCVYRKGELEAFSEATKETGAFCGVPETIVSRERILGQCPNIGSIAVITLGQPVREHGFAVFEDLDRDRKWSDWELDFLKTGVHLIAQALVRARMGRDEQLLAEFGQAVAGVDSREKLAEILSSFTKRHFSWDAFVLALPSTGPGQPDFLYLVDTAEDGSEIREQRDFWSAESLGPRAKRILAGEPLLINRKQIETAKPLETFGYTQRKSASLVFVPIAGRNRVEGMISVQSYTPFAYRKEDLHCLESLAGIAALVLGRLRTQTELHGIEKRFRDIVDMVGAYMWSADVEGQYPSWQIRYRALTPGVEQITGFSARQFLEQGWSLWLKTVYPDDVELVREGLARLAEGKKATATYRIVKPNGQIRWLRDVAVPTLGKQGEIVRIDGISLDVTEEQEVAQERDKLFQAVDRAGEAIVLLSPGGVVEYVNRAFSELTGVPRKKAKGELWYKLGLFEPELEKQRRQILRDLRTRGFWTGRTALCTGEKRLPIEMTTSAVKDSNGQVRHWVVTIRDISERVALEEQLRQSQKLEALGTLAAGIAHDFNNLLTGILGNVELAAMEAPPELQEYFDDARKVARRAADLVRQLLAFARKAPGSKQPLALGPVIKETTKIVAETTDRRIHVKVHVPDDLWVVEGDPVQLQQLVMNLCVNARDALVECLHGANCFGTRRKEPLTIEVRAENVDATRVPPPFPGVAQGTYVKITVTDNGPGMSAETRRRIFEPFFTTKEVGKGTGLGLSTVYGIVTQHNGHIRVRSEPGQGATFEVFLPAVKEGEVSEPALPTTTGVPEEAGGDETILLVDDEDSVRSYVSRMLQRMGYRVIEAGNGREALKAFRRHRDEIALVILDLIMPKMGGEETLAAIRQLKPDAKVVMLSGTWNASLLRRLKQLGAAGFFEKPPEINTFLRAVRKALDESSKSKSRRS